MMIKNQSKPCVERRFVFQCQLQFSYQWFTHVTNSFQVSNMPKTIILEVLSFYCTRLKLRMEVCVYIYISQQFGSTDWFHKSVFSTAAMGKKQASRPTKRNVLSFSKSRMPDISNVQDQPGRVSFKEMKRRSILAGLRFMRSPPAPCLVIANEFKWVSNIFQPFSLFHQNKTQKIIQFGDVSFLPVSVLCSIYIYIAT